MLVSAELRWFWKDAPPRGLDAWFRSGPFPPGGGLPRRDRYLLEPQQTELGIKKRGGSDALEVKGFVGAGTELTKPFEGRIQLWTKWTSRVLSIDNMPQVLVDKARWLRKFDTSGLEIREVALGDDEQPVDRPSHPLDCGCLLEIVAIHIGDRNAPWWTLAFEAFGPLDSVQDSLHRTAAHVSAPSPPSLGDGLRLSYPEWLSLWARNS